MDATALGTSMLMMQMMQVAQSYGALYTILFLVALQYGVPWMRAWVGVWWGTKSTDAVLSIYDDGTEGSAIPRIQNDIMFFLDREGYIDANSNLHLTGCRLPTWNEPPLEPAYRPVVDALVPFQSANITIRFNAVNNTSTTSRQHTLLSIILRGPRIELLKAFVRHCRNYARDHTVEPSGGIWQYGFTSTSRGVICAWSYSPLHLTKSLDNVFIASKARLRADLDAFIDRDTEARYRRWGVPYKRSYLFCGPPGTGKSSLVFAIASHTKRPIYWLPKASEIKDAHGATIGAIFGAIKPYSVVVIDDIDVRMETKRSGSEPGGRSMTSDDFFLSMLEVLDGYRHLHGCIVIATTNHPEKLDPALRRAGRFDLELEIGLLTDGTLDEMLAFYFGADLDAAEMREARALCVGKMSSATLINTYSVPAINAHPLNQAAAFADCVAHIRADAVDAAKTAATDKKAVEAPKAPEASEAPKTEVNPDAPEAPKAPKAEDATEAPKINADAVTQSACTAEAPASPTPEIVHQTPASLTCEVREATPLETLIAHA